MAIASNPDLQLDQQLETWKKRTDIISQALLQLHDLPIYQQLSAHPPADAKTQAILQEVQQLYEQFDQLLNVLQQARQYRDESAGLLSSNQGRAAAQRLLHQSSVPLVLASETRPSEAQIVDQTITPEAAIALLIRRCKTVNATLQQAQADLQQQAAQLRQNLAQAQRDLSQLETLNHSTQALRQEYEQKISTVDGPAPTPQPSLSALRQTLISLSQESTDAPAATARTLQLQQWKQQQQESQQSLESALLFYQERLNLRQELRGRLSALQAKAQAKQKIEDPALSQLAQKAERSLYSRPTSLKQAETLVQQYEQQLNQR